jgi:hypothetical protein
MLSPRELDQASHCESSAFSWSSSRGHGKSDGGADAAIPGGHRAPCWSCWPCGSSVDTQSEDSRQNSPASNDRPRSAKFPGTPSSTSWTSRILVHTWSNNLFLADSTQPSFKGLPNFPSPNHAQSIPNIFYPLCPLLQPTPPKKNKCWWNQRYLVLRPSILGSTRTPSCYSSSTWVIHSQETLYDTVLTSGESEKTISAWRTCVSWFKNWLSTRTISYRTWNTANLGFKACVSS